jgi:hypothetical protein
LRAWDETMADLHAHDEGLFVCRFHTDEITSVEVARRTACAFVGSDDSGVRSPSLTSQDLCPQVLGSVSGYPRTLDGDGRALCGEAPDEPEPTRRTQLEVRECAGAGVGADPYPVYAGGARLPLNRLRS